MAVLNFGILFLSGIGLAFLFPPYNLPVIFIFLFFYPYLKQVSTATNLERIKIGLIFGFGYFCILLKWLNIVGFDALIMLSLVCALWWSIATLFAGFFRNSKFWPVWFAVSFTFFELLRDQMPFGGFGWGQIGILIVNTPFSGIYSLLGQVGTTFLINVFLAWSFLVVSSRSFSIRKNLFFGTAILCTLIVSHLPLTSSFIKTNPSKEIRVVAVQGGVERTGLGTLGQPRAVLRKHIETTISNLSIVNASDYVIWPESSVDLDPFQDSETFNLLIDLEQDVTPPILLGTTLHNADGKRLNSSQELQDGKLTTKYQKRRLVPFGEFLPIRDIVEKYTSRSSLLTTDFAPGQKTGQLQAAEINLGILICFEIADDSLIFDGIENNSATIVQTNNATYQYLGQSEQQILYTRVRAIETGKPIISISTSGVSVLVDETGQIQQQLSQSETGIIDFTISERLGKTIISEIYPFINFFIYILFGIGLLFKFTQRFKIRS